MTKESERSGKSVVVSKLLLKSTSLNMVNIG
jgi:hypothetical protein